jgi:hypothetical protein
VTVAVGGVWAMAGIATIAPTIAITIPSKIKRLKCETPFHLRITSLGDIAFSNAGNISNPAAIRNVYFTKNPNI